MAVDERRRQQMFRKLEELLGPEEAGTLMEYLPPVGWSDLARKDDISLLRGELRNEVAGLKSDIEKFEARLEAKLESRLNSQTKTLVGLMSAQVLAIAGLAFAAARLG